MTARLATKDDYALLEAFLLRHAEGSMFPLGNLRQHGVEPSDQLRSMEFRVVERNGLITGVIGFSKEGFLFPQMPDWDPGLSRFVQRSIAGRPLQGVIGPLEQVHRLRDEFGLDGAPVQHAGGEPQYGLDLSDLIMPDTRQLQLVGLAEGHRELVTEWRCQFLQEVIGQEQQAAQSKATKDVEGYFAMNTHRVLLRSGVPVSFTGFNAALPEIVQVGAVFTPPALRRQGLARAAVAMHLTEARGRGTRRAVLSAASSSAAHAYEAIGFKRIGDFSMIIFDGPQQVHPCPA